jgi:hypothetical protein
LVTAASGPVAPGMQAPSIGPSVVATGAADNYLAAQHARLTSRRGMARAQMAVAHSILVSVYWMPPATSPIKTSELSGWPAATTKP